MSVVGKLISDDTGSLAAESAYWIQICPNQKPELLGCHDLTSLSEDRGSRTLHRKRNMSKRNAWKTSRISQGPPELTTLAITGEVPAASADYLEALSKNFRFFRLTGLCGRPDIFSNWTRAEAVNDSGLIDFEYENLESKEDNAMVMFQTNIEGAFPIHKYFVPQGVSADLGAVGEDAVSLFVEGFSSESADCFAGDCGETDDDGCGRIYIGFVNSLLRVSTDGGKTSSAITVPATWTGDASPPPVSAVLRTGNVLVIFSTTLGAAYSIDDGASWTEIGTVNAVVGSNSAILVDDVTMFAIDAGGIIRKSTNTGMTWSVSHNATLTTENGVALGYNGRKLYALLGADELLVSDNTGQTWSGPYTVPFNGGTVATALSVTGEYIWCGNDAGELWYAKTGSDLSLASSWNQRALPIGGDTGIVKDIVFHDEYYGMVIFSRRLFMTIDGGYYFKEVTVPDREPAVATLSNIAICSPAKSYAVGESHGAFEFLRPVRVYSKQ